MVKLALTGNMSTGGISIDRTFDAHPDNVEIAEEAARLIGLDVAGIDFICPDIASPVRETGGAICEVNAAPGFRMHTHPTDRRAAVHRQARRRPALPARVRPSRVPIVAVTGTNGKTTTSRMIAHIMKGVGRKVGMTSTDGIVIDERLVVQGRRVRPALGPDGAAEPARRLRRHGGGPRRHPARGPGLRPQRRRRRHQRRARPPRACAASTPSSSSPTSRPSSSRRCRATASPCSTPTTSSCAGCGAAARASVVWFSLAEPGSAGARLHRRPLPPRWPGRRARPHRARRHDRHPARPAVDAAGLDPPAARHVRRHGAVQRRQRDGGGRRGLRQRAPGCTRSARACARSRRRTTSPPAG